MIIGILIGLSFGLVLGAWYAARIETLPTLGRIKFSMRDIRRRARLRECMAKNCR